MRHVFEKIVHIRALLAIIAGVALASCRTDAPRTSAQNGDTDSAAAGAPSAPPASDVAAVAEETVADVCPFECCMYGMWTAEAEIPVYAREGDTTTVVWTYAVGDTIDAKTGNVHLHPPGLAVMTDTITVTGGKSMRLAVGDTITILNYEGEGYWMVRFRDQVASTEGFFAADGETSNRAGGSRISARVIQEPVPSWWVNVKATDGRQGWILMRRESRVSGADACG